MRAVILLRPNRPYRGEVFAEGLSRHGYETITHTKFTPTEKDVLVVWNRKRSYDALVEKYQRAGARVIVAENGYLDRVDGKKMFSLALDHHLGAGRWLVGDKPRFEVEQEPWREKRGDEVLLLPQRGIGERRVAMPSGWLTAMKNRLQACTNRPIRIRLHPGHQRRHKVEPLERALDRAHCVVTWASGAGIKAIRYGVPCFHEFDGWIGNAASTRLDAQVEQCHTPDRSELWRRVTWAQWTKDEIRSGVALDGLLNAENRSLFCAR